MTTLVSSFNTKPHIAVELSVGKMHQAQKTAKKQMSAFDKRISSFISTFSKVLLVGTTLGIMAHNRLHPTSYSTGDKLEVVILISSLAVLAQLLHRGKTTQQMSKQPTLKDSPLQKLLVTKSL